MPKYKNNLCKQGHDLTIHRKVFGGTQTRCGLCQDIRNAEATGKLSKQDNRLKLQKWRLKTYFGMTVSDFDAMASKQHNRCVICSSPPRGRWHYLHVDHNHRSGKVRGLLCNSCNLGLGKFKDDPAILRRAASYLEQHAS